MFRKLIVLAPALVLARSSVVAAAPDVAEPASLIAQGDADERAERYASAVAAFERARTIAARGGDTTTAEAASKRVAALKPTLSSMTIVLEDETVPTRITVDGRNVPTIAPLTLDGGEHVITATASCYRPFTVRERLAARSDAKRVRIRLVPSDEPSCTAPTHGADTWKTVAFGVGGLGLISLAIGTVIGITAASGKSKLDESCPSFPSDCPASRRDEILTKYDAVHTRATLATVTLISGLVFAGGAVALYLLAPGARKSSAQVRDPLRITF